VRNPPPAAHLDYVSVIETIEKFVKASGLPVAMEPGDDPIALAPNSFVLTARGATVTLECWSQTRNLVRRVRSIREQRRGRLELEVERFGASTGTLMLVDMSDPGNRDVGRRGSRLKYRERFRRSLRRQYPDWRIAELTTEPDLHHSLSPSYPRALLRKGSLGIAAIGSSEDSLSPEGVLSFGLIWLDYLKRREARVAIEALAIFVPQAAAATTCHRVRYLDGVRFYVFVHDPSGHEDAVDPGDYTNFETRLEAFAGGSAEHPWVRQLVSVHGVDQRAAGDGSVSLAVRGLEFARASASELRFGIDQKQVAGASNLLEIEELARGLERMRAASAADRQNPLYLRHPEAWLESQVRRGIEQIDANLYPAPVYGQVPQFAGGERGVMDLLAVDRDARLAVIEVKAVEDIHLPLQALDYWMRVKWHLDRNEFSGRGYFPEIELGRRAPRLILVAPALDFHPSNEVVLGYFSAGVEAERVGVGVEWRKELRVMFRAASSNCHGPRRTQPG
jgi:hypothetical protein